MTWNDGFEALYNFPDFWWSHDRCHAKIRLMASPKGARKKSMRRSNKLKKKPRPKYKRPKRPADASACCRTSPKCGPLNEIMRRVIMSNRTKLPKSMAPLTKNELLRILQPRMGLPPKKCPQSLRLAAQSWEFHLP